MRIDRAMAFLLEGHAVQRAAWIEPENRRIENIGGRFCFAGTQIVFTRPIPYIRQVYLNMYDMEANDWQIVHHYHDGDKVEVAPSPQPREEGE